MTRERMYGSDTEFCDWMRKCKQLPAYSKDFGFVACDNDLTVHRYMTSIDSVGTREVQGIMQIEVKTRNGKPSSSQTDTLSKLNLFKGSRDVSGIHIRFFGVFVLVMNGTTPDNSSAMWWCNFRKDTPLDDASGMRKDQITRDQLISLLRFDLHPVGLYELPFRRHHATKSIVEVIQAPLGFEYERVLIHRS